MKLFVTAVLAALGASVQAQCNNTDAGGLYALAQNVTSDLLTDVMTPNCGSMADNFDCAEAVVANLTMGYNSCNCTGAFAKALVRDMGPSQCGQSCIGGLMSQNCLICLNGKESGVGLGYQSVIACSQGSCPQPTACESCNATEAALPMPPAGHCDAEPSTPTQPPTSTPPPPAPMCEPQDRFGLVLTLNDVGKAAAANMTTFQANVGNCLSPMGNSTVCDAWIDSMMYTKCACTRQYAMTVMGMTALTCANDCTDLTSNQCIMCLDKDMAMKNATGVGYAEVLGCGASPDPSCGYSQKCASCGACANRPQYPQIIDNRRCTTNANDACGAVATLLAVLSDLDVVMSCISDCIALPGLPITDEDAEKCGSCVAKATKGANTGCDCLGATVLATLGCADTTAITNCGTDEACVANSLSKTCTGALEAPTGLPIDLFTHPVVTATECSSPVTEVICSAEGVDLRKNPPAGSAMALTGAAGALMAAVAAAL